MFFVNPLGFLCKVLPFPPYKIKNQFAPSFKNTKSGAAKREYVKMYFG